jgi:aminoglycoside N3'-acetyltransferase
MAMLERYEKWTDIEQRMVNMEARFLELHKRDFEKEKDTDRRAVLEAQIRLLEESLAKNKFYKPFQRKPSLIAPTMLGGGSQV